MDETQTNASRDQPLLDLIAALRRAEAQAGAGCALHLALAAFIAVYGMGGAATISNALRSS